MDLPARVCHVRRKARGSTGEEGLETKKGCLLFFSMFDQGSPHHTIFAR